MTNERGQTVAVAYRRVSTDAQGGADRFGLESQRKQIEDYAAANNIDIVKWYDDVGESGAKDNRPALTEILYGDEIKNPPFEMVLVAKADRIARDIYLYYAYKHQLNQKNIRLVSVAEDFGSMGAFAPVLEAFIVAMAQVERQTITQRTYAARKMKSTTGKHTGGPAPLGYDLVEKRLVPNEKEAAIVKDIFWMLSMGSTYAECANTLNKAQYRTKRGEEFTRTHIVQIFDRAPVYLGKAHNLMTDEWIEGEHDAIITQEEYEAAREGVNTNPLVKKRKRYEFKNRNRAQKDPSAE